MTKTYPALRETVQERVLPNGLRVCYLPKEGFSKTFAILATDFGSVDASFTFEGKRYDTPAGVAHFLEHKMFEDEDGNALQKFACTGASPNAFTSHTMTAYHFSCTERFEENLEILLKFVFTPYFTEENVAKERGIIGQEIRMVEDTPSWQVYCGLFRALYREHPVRVSIPGSEETIARITPELLFTCHRAFYSPKNMALVVCGTADFEKLCETAARLSPKDAPEVGQRHYGTRRREVSEPVVTQHMQVSRPQFLVGFKDIPVQPGESRMKRLLIGELASRLLCGDNSPLYTALYEKQLIGRDFDTDYAIIPDGTAVVLGGESRDPEAARDAIAAEVQRLARKGVDKALFRRMKRAIYGLHLRVCDVPDSYARQEVTALFSGEHYADFASLLESVTPEDVQAALTRWAQPECMAMSVVLPGAASHQ